MSALSWLEIILVWTLLIIGHTFPESVDQRWFWSGHCWSVATLFRRMLIRGHFGLETVDQWSHIFGECWWEVILVWTLLISGHTVPENADQRSFWSEHCWSVVTQFQRMLTRGHFGLNTVDQWSHWSGKCWSKAILVWTLLISGHTVPENADQKSVWSGHCWSVVTQFRRMLTRGHFGMDTDDQWWYWSGECWSKVILVWDYLIQAYVNTHNLKLSAVTEPTPSSCGLCNQKWDSRRRRGRFLGILVQISWRAFVFKRNLEWVKWGHSKEPYSLHFSVSRRTISNAGRIVEKWIAAWKYYGRPRREMHSPEPTGQTAGIPWTGWLWMRWTSVALRSLPVVRNTWV